MEGSQVHTDLRTQTKVDWKILFTASFPIFSSKSTYKLSLSTFLIYFTYLNLLIFSQLNHSVNLLFLLHMYVGGCPHIKMYSLGKWAGALVFWF